MHLVLAQPVTLTFDLRGFPGWMTPALLHAVEGEEKAWEVVPSRWDAEGQVLTAQVARFSGYQITGASDFPDDGTHYLLRNLPDVSTFSGAASYAYALTVPPGRNGMVPELSLRYNIKQNGWTFWTGAALAVDVACLVLPIATGGGVAVRAASHADDVVDAARAVDRVDDAADLADGLRQLDQAGDAVRVASQVPELSRAAEFGVDTVGSLKNLTRGQGLEVHHIIEQRFAKGLGISRTDDMLGVVLTHEEHVRFTQAWRQRIGYNNQLMDLVTGTAKRDAIWRAAQEIYKDYPGYWKLPTSSCTRKGVRYEDMAQDFLRPSLRAGLASPGYRLREGNHASK